MNHVVTGSFFRKNFLKNPKNKRKREAFSSIFRIFRDFLKVFSKFQEFFKNNKDFQIFCFLKEFRVLFFRNFGAAKRRDFFKEFYESFKKNTGC